MPKHNIPVFHPNHGGAPPAPQHGGGGNPGGGGTPGTKPGAGTNQGTSSTSTAMQQYNAQQSKLQHKAATKYTDAAERMLIQARALRIALGKHGLVHRLNTQLANLDMRQAVTDRALMHDYRNRYGALENAQADNERAAAGQTYANLTNRNRERTNAMSEAMANGAGESDLLRAQSMSLNNWNANQNEVNRSFYDSRSSINSSLVDLNADTRTGRLNNVLQSNTDREQVYNSYWDRRSETLTALGNTLGQAAEYYGDANEQVGSKKSKKAMKATEAREKHAFNAASIASGKAYEDPGIPKKIRQWQGHADFDATLNNSKFSSASTELTEKKPEGAALRSWT